METLPSLPLAAAPDADRPRAVLLRHFAPEIREAYERFLSTGEPAAADTVIVAVVRDHMPEREDRRSLWLEDRLALAADLGFDSIATTEMVFFIEDLMRVSVSNAEITGVRTIGDLRAFVRAKIAARNAAPAAAKA